MKQKLNDQQAWIGFAVLLVLVAGLGVKSRQTARTVLQAASNQGGSAVHSSDDPHGIISITYRDSLIAEAETNLSNPFRHSTVAVPTTVSRQPAATPTVRKPTEPKLLTLLYDEVGPCVQINVGNDRSGWLHVGEEFQGWNVDEIANSAVTVSRAGHRVVLK